MMRVNLIIYLEMISFHINTPIRPIFQASRL